MMKTTSTLAAADLRPTAQEDHPPQARRLYPAPILRTDFSEDFSARVKPHIPLLFRVALKRMRCRDLAWDAVQDSLVTLWKTGEKPAQTRPWLVQTVIHRCLHMQRTARRRQHYEELSMLFHKTHHEGDCREPFQETERGYLRQILSEALKELPEEQRTVLWLREVESMDYRGIAERQGISPGTVRSRLHRARAAMRVRLQEVFDRDNCELCRKS
jgi:RNA polymerase sigma-70 factor (ECF subfamily)